MMKTAQTTSAAKESEFAEMVLALCERDAYPERPQNVEHLETHISHVFLTDRHAYKLKKPVKYDFLDYSTPGARRTACHSELVLNRRLAPDVYLDVVPITHDTRAGFVVGGDGRPIEWIVKMRRLARDRALDRLIRAGELSNEQIEQIASYLARFYANLPPQNLAAEEYRKSVETHVRGNLEELQADLTGDDLHLVRRIHTAQLLYLQTAVEEFDRRVCDGRIVEGHGDLRPEHIYLAPRPTIIDCIEFNFDFRRLDVADELGFLDTELALLGAEGVGEKILARYCATCDDPIPANLLDFYRSYRACVRSKVAALRAKQVEGAEREDSVCLAGRYLRLADRYAARLGKPLLIVVRGLMGVGKSTLAARLAETLAIDHLETDAVRRELFGEPSREASYGEGRYSPENRRKVYDEMFARAQALLANGRSVVLDGVFLAADLRSQAVEIAEKCGARPLIVHCRCSDEVAQQRIAERAAEGQSLSDARPELYESQKRDEQADPPNTPSLVVDTSQGAAPMLQAVWRRLRAGE